MRFNIKFEQKIYVFLSYMRLGKLLKS